MDANGIAQVAPGAVGVHLSWSGIRPWVYAPGGFTIQRRQAERPAARRCASLDEPAIVTLRAIGERRPGFGALTVRAGSWLAPLNDPTATDPTAADVVRLDLDEDQRLASVAITAKLSFAVGLREGRVVAVSGPVATAAVLSLGALVALLAAGAAAIAVRTSRTTSATAKP